MGFLASRKTIICSLLSPASEGGLQQLRKMVANMVRLTKLPEKVELILELINCQPADKVLKRWHLIALKEERIPQGIFSFD
jgi:hypothetical protein